MIQQTVAAGAAPPARPCTGGSDVNRFPLICRQIGSITSVERNPPVERRGSHVHGVKGHSRAAPATTSATASASSAPPPAHRQQRRLEGGR